MQKIKTWVARNKLHPYLLIVILILAPLPFFGVLFSLYGQKCSLDAFELKMQQLHKKELLFQELQKKETSFLNRITHSDPGYLEKTLESFYFLEPEVKKLEALSLHWEQDQNAKGRLIFLKEGSNRLSFATENIRRTEGWQEVEIKQQHPIECSDDDLKRLLSQIEGVTIWPYGPKEGLPQLIIKDFELGKKPLTSQESVFVVNMQLIKRENLSSNIKE